MKKVIAIIGLLLPMIAFAASNQEIDVSLNKIINNNYLTSPNEVISDSITLTNLSSKDLQIELEFKDTIRSDYGGLDVIDVIPGGLASAASLTKSTLLLPANSKEIIPFSITSPASINSNTALSLLISTPSGLLATKIYLVESSSDVTTTALTPEIEITQIIMEERTTQEIATSLNPSGFTRTEFYYTLLAVLVLIPLLTLLGRHPHHHRRLLKRHSNKKR